MHTSSNTTSPSTSASAIYFGLGGTGPGVVLAGGDGEVTRVAGGQAGESVYGLALSPHGTRLALGTRTYQAGDQFGRILVWERRPDATLAPGPVAGWYQPGAVTALAMPSENIVLSGGLDGQIHAWRLDIRDRHATRFPAHAGPVLALACLSPQVAASLGADGLLRIWDLDTLQCVAQHQDQGPPAVRGLLSLAWADDLGLLAALYPSGNVILHRPGEPLESIPLPLPGGPAGAMALTGGHVLIADLHAPVLRLLSLPEGREISTASCPGPVLALCAAGPDRAAAISRDGGADLWVLRPVLAQERKLALTDGRCAAGPPRPFQMRQAAQAETMRRQEMLARVREAAASGGVQALYAHFDALSRNGLGLEALVMLADACLRENRPIWALRARLALARELPPEPWSARHLYALGVLLEDLNEPSRAKVCLERALECDPDLARNAHFADVAERLRRLAGYGPPELDPADTVRDDFGFEAYAQARKTAVLQEVEKAAALDTPWVWPVALRLGNPLRLGAASLELDGLHQALARTGGGWELRTLTVREARNRLVQRQWLVLAADPGPDQGQGLGLGLEYAVALREIAGAVHLAHRLVLAPPHSAEAAEPDPDDTALAVAANLEHLAAPAVTAWVDAIQSRVNAAANTEARAASTSVGQGLSVRRRSH